MCNNSLQVSLKLNKNIDINYIKQDLQNICLKGFYSHKYSFEINLIYKIIHEHSNYEKYQWEFYSNTKEFVIYQMKSLLLEISNLDNALTWDCVTVLKRYKNVYKQRHYLAKKYIRRN
jgi:hypothetical protein